MYGNGTRKTSSELEGALKLVHENVIPSTMVVLVDPFAMRDNNVPWEVSASMAKVEYVYLDLHIAWLSLDGGKVGSAQCTSCGIQFDL